MDINNIVQFRLLKSEFKKISINDSYKLIHLTEANYDEYLSELLYVVELLHIDLEWDGIPNKDEIIKRFQNKSECFLWLYDDVVVGWTWFNSNITIDWINLYQQLNPNELYVGGAFLSRKSKTPPIAGFKFYNYSFYTWLTDLKYHTIYLYSDSWNRASAQLCYKCGFTQYNFLNENN